MAFKREAVIKSAEKYVARGKIENAIREYRKVLADNPTDTSTLNRVGDLYARIERFDEAVRLFTQIAEHYTSDGFFVKAIAIYKKIIKLDPTALRVYEKLAALYAKQGLITEARTQYQVLADYYQKHDNVASAITIYQRMAELEPDNPSFRLKLADLYTSRSLTDKAMQELRSLAEIFVRSGSLEEATQVFVRALDTSSDDLDFVEQAAELLQRHGSPEGAGRVLARAAERNPAATKIARQLGITLPGMASVAPEVEEVVETASEDDRASEDDSGLEGADNPLALDEVALEAPDSQQIDTDFDIDLSEGSPLDMGAPDASAASDVFHFDLDLDDDESPSSLVQPPADMLDSAIAAADAAVDEVAGPAETPEAASEVFELVIGDLEDEEPGAEADPVVDPLADLVADDELPIVDEVSEALPAAEDDEPIEIEIDWEFDGLEDDEIDPSTGLVASDGPSDAAPDDDSAVGAEAEAVHVDATDATVDVGIDDAPAVDDQATEIEPVEDDLFDGGDVPEITLADDGEFDLELPDLELDADVPLELDAEVEVEIEADEAPDAELVDLEATIQTSPEPPEVPSVAPASVTPLDLDATVATAAARSESVVESTPPAEPIAEPITPAAESPAVVPPPAAVAPPAVTPPAAAPPAVTPPAAAPLSVAPPAVSAARRQDDLFAEAQVFSKYGLRDKAEERLAELHERNPEHLGGWLLVTRMHLEAGQAAEVVNHANRVAMLARQTGEPEAWDHLREELDYAGYALDGDVVVGEPNQKERKRENRISQFLEMLDAPTEAREPSAEPVAKQNAVVDAMPAAEAPVGRQRDEPVGAARPAPDIDDQADRVGADVLDASEVEPTEIAPDDLALDDDDADVDLAIAGLGEAVRPSADRKVNLVEELGLDEGPESAPSASSDVFDDSGMSWLDDTQVPKAEPTAATEAIFDEEDDFFDLAAELERELSEEDEAEGTTAVSQAEGQSLEEIVEGFKKGVAEHLSAEDYDTHFNLGIAYREMGLLDEAIGEFQLASKDSRYLVESSSMLGMCFLEKGLPELAIKWYRKGLASPAIRDEESMGLLYEMGGVYDVTGDHEAARKTFVEVYGMDSGYRDVADRLRALDEA